MIAKTKSWVGLDLARPVRKAAALGNTKEEALREKNEKHEKSNMEAKDSKPSSKVHNIKYREVKQGKTGKSSWVLEVTRNFCTTASEEQ